MSLIKYRNCPLQCEHLVPVVQDFTGNFTTTDDGVTGSIDDGKSPPNYLTVNSDSTYSYGPDKKVFHIDYENRLLVFTSEFTLKFKVPYHA